MVVAPSDAWRVGPGPRRARFRHEPRPALPLRLSQLSLATRGSAVEFGMLRQYHIFNCLCAKPRVCAVPRFPDNLKLPV